MLHLLLVAGLVVDAAPKAPEVRRNHALEVVVTVKNVSAVKKSFGMMSCSWPEEWRVSGGQLEVQGYDCTKNVERELTLQPGEEDRRTLILYVPKRAPDGWASFMVGFAPIGEKEPVWSKPMMVKIDP